jgi:crotonobetainyl-CoA:carnitine CoA-transferase CaiB-like acyl-CoA transferase
VQAPYTGQYFLLGRQQPRMGNSIDWYAPYNSYECGDGLHLQLACFNDKFFANLCAALGQRELVTDARFATNEARLEHRHDLDAIIGAFCLARPRAEVLDQLWAHDSIAGPIHTYEDVFSDPQVLANEMVVEVPHHRGPLRVTGVPVHLDETPGSVRRPPPGLGEHSREVLEELHLDPDLIDRLVRRDTP